MEYDYYPEEEIKSGSLVRKILKYVIIAFVIAVYALIFFRIAIKEAPKDMRQMIWTEEALAAYNESKDGFRVQNQQVRSFSYQNENGDTVKVVHNVITDDGYFQTSNFMYNEQTKELTVTFRYNNASLEWLKSEYGLSSLPEGEPYFIALYTSEGHLTEYSYLSRSRFTYGYQRAVFKNVDLSKESVIELDIYYMGDVDLEKPLASLPVYDSRIPAEYYSVKDALPAKLTKGVKKAPYVVTEE